MSPKPLTWQRGSLSLWQWLWQSLHCRATHRASKNGRGGSAVHVPAVHPLSLPSANYARPFTPSFPSNDFNAVCLGAIEKTEGSHLFSGEAALLWMCTHIAMLVPRGYRQHAGNSHDVVDNRPPGSFTTCFFLLSFLSFFLTSVQVFHCV